MSAATRALFALALIASFVACGGHRRAQRTVPVVTHGVAAGDVSATRAVIWGRCSEPAHLRVFLRAANETSEQSRHVPVQAATDCTGKIAFDGLLPDTRYEYRVACTPDRLTAAVKSFVGGEFSTAPAALFARPLRFAWGGDVGGQNVCRDRDRGYPIFDVILASRPAFFIALGDLIYADDSCDATGRYGNEQIVGPTAPAIDLPMFWEHWKYNRADAAFQRLLAAMPIYPIWDDHETTNDAGPGEGSGSHLLQGALQAFLHYEPIFPPTAQPTRLYTSVRWGKHLELFILDLRQYRDANLAQDSTTRPKTMLGAAQRRWFLDRLQHSEATWKVIVSSVPLSIPTGAPGLGHDGWADDGAGDGFENELVGILRAMQATSPRNYLWITTDVHFGAAFRYAPFTDDPEFAFIELISGPLNAGVFPQEAYDRTLHTERLLKYGPPTAASIASFDEAMKWFTFGVVDIDADGGLNARLVNGRGDTVYELHLSPGLIPLEPRSQGNGRH
jgi:alkaline phosphatase D